MSSRSRSFALVLCAVLFTGAGRARAQVTETSVTLGWTAPGDDSTSGRAWRYDLRWATTPIVSAADFIAAQPLAVMPVPHDAGTAESFTVTGLLPATDYWFALVTLDESGNRSGLSNVLQATTLESPDVVRPAPVSLSLVASTATSVTVGWNDSGDDSLSGRATLTEVRWSYAPIGEAQWALANIVPGVPPPGEPGTAQQVTLQGVDRTREVYLVARARDDVNRVSALATAVHVPHLLDTAPPSAPLGLTAAVEGTGVRVQWEPNPEADLRGYHVFRSLSAKGLYTRLTTTPVALSTFVDPAPPDTLLAWYKVTAMDASGNESARSVSTRVTLRADAPLQWAIAPPYPNPSHVGDLVVLPLTVPVVGSTDVVIDIQDDAGQHVRALHVTNATPGTLKLVWDGRNDAGRMTVPGLYRVWMRDGARRELARIVRQP